MNTRFGKKSDFKQVVNIYNQVILEGGVIGYSMPFSYKDCKGWFNGYLKGKYPILVAEEANRVVGWITLSPYREGRDLLDRTCAVSYFVEKSYRGIGIGSLLLKEALTEAKNRGFKVVLALVFDHNAPSIKLLEKHGFTRWAFLPGVAEWEGKLLDHVYYGIKVV